MTLSTRIASAEVGSRELDVADEWLEMAENAPIQRALVVRYVPICGSEIEALKSIVNRLRATQQDTQS